MVMLLRRRTAWALQGVITCQAGSSEGNWGPGVAATIAAALGYVACRLEKL